MLLGVEIEISALSLFPVKIYLTELFECRTLPLPSIAPLDLTFPICAYVPCWSSLSGSEVVAWRILLSQISRKSQSLRMTE